MTIHESTPHSDYRSKVFLGFALTVLSLLTPFAINNFVQGRWLLGLGSAAVILIISFNAWGLRHGRYSPALTQFGLVPVMILFLVLSVRQQGIIGVLWCYPAVVAMYMLLDEKPARWTNLVLVGAVIPQAWLVIDHAIAWRMVVSLGAVSLFTAIFIHVIADQSAKLQALAATDALTGVYNRTFFEHSLDRARELNARTGNAAALLLMDIDHFKKINDELGHAAGDRVLCDFTQRVRDQLRASDLLFRIGGEEFVVLLDGADQPKAQRVAEKLRAAIAGHKMLPDRRVTVSIGVAGLGPDDSTADWLRRADQRLYQAKALGRDRVVTGPATADMALQPAAD